MPAQESLAQLIDPHEFWLGFLRAVLDIWAQIEDAVDGDEVSQTGGMTDDPR